MTYSLPSWQSFATEAKEKYIAYKQKNPVPLKVKRDQNY